MAGRFNVDEVANSAGTGPVKFPFGFIGQGSQVRGPVTASTDTVTSADNVVVYNPASNAIAVALPAAAGVTGLQLSLLLSTSIAHKVTVTPNGADTIAGYASVIMGSLNDYLIIESDGTGVWKIVSWGVSVAFLADTNAQTCTAGNTVIIFSNVSNDGQGAYNASTGIWTCPYAGRYSVQSLLTFNSATQAVSGVLGLQLFKGSSILYKLGAFIGQSTNSTNSSVWGGVTVGLAAGDTLKMNLNSASSAPTVTADGSATGNYFAVSRIGN